jgi:hypothetical protein
VDRSSQEIKDYTQKYEDQRAIVEVLSAAEQAGLGNKPNIDIRVERKRQLEVARLRETTALSLLVNCPIADNNVVKAQAVATAATVTPTVATNTPLTSITAEKKIMKRKLPEPRDGWT